MFDSKHQNLITPYLSSIQPSFALRPGHQTDAGFVLLINDAVILKKNPLVAVNIDTYTDYPEIVWTKGRVSELRWGKDFVDSLVWKASIQFTSISDSYDINLPAKYRSITLWHKESNCSVANYTMKVYWIQEIYKQYRNFSLLHKTPQICNQNFTVREKFDHCINFSSVMKQYKTQKYYILLRKFIQRPYKTKINVNTSCIEAFNLCKSAHAYLPVLRSRDETDELLALIKFRYQAPPSQVIFIGLLHKNCQVNVFEMNKRSEKFAGQIYSEAHQKKSLNVL